MAQQTKLLSQVVKLVPKAAKVVLYADREYGSAGLFEFLHKQGWYFVIRMKKDIWCVMSNGRHFQIQEIPLAPGQINFEDGVFLRDLPGMRLSLNCGWSSLDPKDEAWYLGRSLVSADELAGGQRDLAPLWSSVLDRRDVP